MCCISSALMISSDFRVVFQLSSKFFFIGVQMTVFIALAKLLPMGSPVCSIKLKGFLISLMRSSSSLSSPSSLLPPFALAIQGLSASLLIWSSYSDPPCRDNSSSSGAWQHSPVSLLCILLFWHLDDRHFCLAFLIQFHPNWLL